MKYLVTKNHEVGTAILTIMGDAHAIDADLLKPVIAEWILHKAANPSEDHDDHLWELHVKAHTDIVRDDLPFFLKGCLPSQGDAWDWTAELSPVDYPLPSDRRHVVAVYLIRESHVF